MLLLLYLVFTVAILLATRVSPSESQSCGSVMGDGYIGTTFPTCTRCPEGTYAIAGDTACTPCPDNSVSVSGSGSCQCKNGYGQSGIDKTLSCTLCSSSQVFYSNSCPAGYTYYASTRSCYQYVSTGKSWNDANTFCNSNGRGYLVTINSETENKFVHSIGSIWVGFNDQIVEGSLNFVWTHGTSSYTNWRPTEPNNANNNQDCARYFVGQTWDDDVCSYQFAFLCEADPITTCSSLSTLSECSDMPPVANSLVGYYNAKSWDGSNWNDLSGYNNHVTSNLITGIVTVQNFDTISGLDALTGTTSTTITWPNAILPSTYTLFHLSKYNGANKGRIISSVSPANWLSGHWGNLPVGDNSRPQASFIGVACHNAWMTLTTAPYGNPDDWLLSSDQNALYRAQGVDLTIASPGSPSHIAPIAINKFGGEVSDWAVATVLVYSRTLTGDEIEQVERWLYSIYFNRSSMGSSATKAYRLFPNCYVPPLLSAYSSNVAYTDVITTVAGSSTAAGSTDGLASRSSPLATTPVATFNIPVGITIDSFGNVYVCDLASNKIRKINPLTNMVSTIAGTGAPGSTDGALGISTVNTPYGLVLDDHDTLYFSEAGGHRIRKLTLSTNTVSTIAGTSSTTYNTAWDTSATTASTATFYEPRGIALNSYKTKLYVADANNRIRMLDLSASPITVSLVAGTGATTPYNNNVNPKSANIAQPHGIALDSNDNIYFSEAYDSYRLRKISSDGSILTTIAGSVISGYSGDGGLAINAAIGMIHTITLDSAGNLYFNDYTYHVVRKISSSTGVITTIAGRVVGGVGIADNTGDGYSAANSNINTPLGVYYDTITDSLYISTSTSIRRIRMAGHVENIEPILSYSTLNGNIGIYTYTDGNYNGDGLTTTPGSALSGGVGLLTDGIIATCDWSVCSNTNPAGKGPYLGWNNGVFYQTYYFSNYVGTIIHRIEYYFKTQTYGYLEIPSLFTVDGIYRAYTVDVLVASTSTTGLTRVCIAGLQLTGSSHKIGFTTVTLLSAFVSEVIFYSYTTPQVIINANFQLDYTATYTNPAISINSWSSGIISAYKDTTYGGLPTYPGALISYNYGDFYVNIVGADSILTQTIVVEENSYITITFSARYQPNTAYISNPPEASRSYSSYYDSSINIDHKYSMLDSSLGWGCWAAGTSDLNQYMTIDLGSLQYVSGVVTQARCSANLRAGGYSNQYVSTYKVGYSTDGSGYTLASTSALSQTFYGPQSYSLQTSCDLDEKIFQYFMSTITARYIRFYPQTWTNFISMRAGIVIMPGLEVSLGGTTLTIAPLTSIFKVYYSNSISFTTSNDAGTKVSKVLQFKTLASSCSSSNCNAQVDMVSFASYSLTGWTKVLSKGAFGAVDLTEAVINSNFAASSPQVFVRSCPSCAMTHKVIYYRRLTAIPASPFSIYKQMSSQWTISSNTLGTDFGLYYTLDDALRNINSWTFCSYNDNTGVGFPRACGPTIGSSLQWNSFGCGTGSCTNANQGQADVAFYILNPEANALCGFKQGISNWPGSSGGAMTGWDCGGSTSSGVGIVATSFPCSGVTSLWTGVTCSSSGLVTGLSLTSRGLVGTISSSISALTGLTSLDLSSNSLFGSIPPQVSALTSLTTLYLNSNSLSKSIPFQLSSLTLLTSLHLNSNRFSNFIPSQVSALVKITSLYLNDNRLEGPAGSFLCITTGISIYMSFDVDSKFNFFGFMLMNGASISSSNKQVGTGSVSLNAANSQYVSVSPFTTGSSGMSFSFWFRSSNTGNWGHMFDFGNDPSSDNIFFGVYNNYVAWGVAIGSTAYFSSNFYNAVNVNDNVWRHIVWTINPNGVWSLYMNGISVYTTTLVYPNVIQRMLNYIGKSNWAGNPWLDPYFNGAIDDFRYYDRVLSGGDVTDIYSTPFKNTIYFTSIKLQNNYFSCIDTCASTLAESNKDSATPVGSSCYYPSSIERIDANSLCGFKQGMTNWPGGAGGLSTSGWGCSSGDTALTYPCGPAGYVTYNPPEASRSYTSTHDNNNANFAYSMLDSSSGRGCWAAGTNDLNQYMTIDLGSLQYVSGVVTQARCTYLANIQYPGDSGSFQYVATYKVGYSTDGVNYNLATSAASSQTFYGPQSAPLRTSCALDEKVMQYFISAMTARYIRVYPQTWTNYMSLRAGLIMRPVGLASWTGITCSSSGLVTGLSLTSRGLVGTISSSISALTGLTSLDLCSNSLFGSIPPQVSALTSLTTLYLNSNSLIKLIPSQISVLIKLTQLHLNSNLLEGPAGSFLCTATLTGTSNLQLQGNKFSCIDTCAATRAGWISGFYDTIVPVGAGCVNPSSQPSRQPSSQPSRRPSSLPTNQPSMQPTRQPLSHPSMQPSRQPSSQPSQPSCQPSCKPSIQPSCQPSYQPFSLPTSRPSQQPSSLPSLQPSNQPTSNPTMQPFAKPSSQPSLQPSHQPSFQPTSQPTRQPTSQPSSHPSRQPTKQPTRLPTTIPSMQPTIRPTQQPSKQPSRQPSSCPTEQPTLQPSIQPSDHPSRQPSQQPTSLPTMQPSKQPSNQPSIQPSRQPTSQPSFQPTSLPTMQPTQQPTLQPSMQPTRQPVRTPTTQPSSQPSMLPSKQPTSRPSRQPSIIPTSQPSSQPFTNPSSFPSKQPSSQPSSLPSKQPLSSPTILPSRQPSQQPTSNPSNPSSQPSHQPTSQPSRHPSYVPTTQPSSSPLGPSTQPTKQPTRTPSSQPSRQPSKQPYSKPSTIPTIQPSCRPTRQPSLQPSISPTSQPSSQPSLQPSVQPSAQPYSYPSTQPSLHPSSRPSQQPSSMPSCQPSANPSQPSSQPTKIPSLQPSSRPTTYPSIIPSRHPSSQPSIQPTSQPYRMPSSRPSKQPTSQPSIQPSLQPYSYPSNQPTLQPSSLPTRFPSSQPSLRPTIQPTRLPTSQPTSQPSRQPTIQPSRLPSNQPTSNPSNPSSQPSINPSSQPSSAPSEFSNIWIVNVTRFDDDFYDPSLGAPNMNGNIKTTDFDSYCTNENWRTTSSTSNCTLRLAIYYCLFRYPWSSSNNNNKASSSSSSRCHIVIPPDSLIRFNKSFAFTESRFQGKYPIRISIMFQRSVYVITDFLIFDFGLRRRDIVSLAFENVRFHRDLSNLSNKSRRSGASDIIVSSGSRSSISSATYTPSTTISSNVVNAVFNLSNLDSVHLVDVALDEVALRLQAANIVSISNSMIYNVKNHHTINVVSVYALDIGDVSSIDIVNTSFHSNAAGALLVDNCLMLTIRGCYFTNNTAAFGSAMYLSKVRSSVISSSSFIANMANQAGTVYWLYNTMFMNAPNVTSDNIWSDNFARYYGNKTASSFCGNNCLRFSPDAIQVTDYSNISLPSLITVDIVDYYGSIMSYYNGNRVRLSANQELSNCGGLLGSDQVIRHNAAVVDKANNVNYMSFYLKNGSTVFSNVGVSCLPSGHMSLEFAVSLSAPYDVFKYRVDVYSNNLPIAFRNCIRGEIFDLISVTQSTCSKCVNSYSFSDNSNFGSVSTSCLACPVEALSCEGDQIYLYPGTWRPNSDTTTIYACQSIYACAGGNSSGTAGCSVGYNGPLCGVCAKDYYLSDSKQCKSCQIQIQPILQSFGYLLSLCVCIAVAVKVLKEKLRIDIKEYLKDDFFTSVVSGVISSYQIILLGMGSTSSFKSLASFSNLLSYFKLITINLSSMLSLPCFFEYNYFSSLKLILLLPFSTCALLVVLALLSRSAEARNKYYTILVNVLCFFIPISSSASFQYFQCSNGGGGEYYLASDLSIKCSGVLYEYNKIWAVAGVLIYTTGIPILFLYLLYNRKRLIARKVLIDNYRSVLSYAEFAHMKFSLHYELLPPLDGLYLRSKAEYWWFNTFNIFISIFLTSVVTFLFAEDNTQLLVSIVVLLFSYRIQIHRNPYSYDLDNRFSIWSTFQLVLLYISLYVRTNLGLGLDGKKYAMLDVLMVALNLFIIILAIYYLYKHFKEKKRMKKKSMNKASINADHAKSDKNVSIVDNTDNNNDDYDFGNESRLTQEEVEADIDLYKPFGVELDYMSFDDLRGVGTRELLTVMGVLYLRLAPRGTYTNLKKKYRDVGSIIDSLHATNALPFLYFISNQVDDKKDGEVDNDDKVDRVLRAVTIFSQSRQPDEKMAHLICRRLGGVGFGVVGLPVSVFVNLGRYISMKYAAFTTTNAISNIKANPQFDDTFQQEYQSQLVPSSGSESVYNSIMDDLMRDLESSPTEQDLLGGRSEEEFFSHCEGEFLKYDLLYNPNHNINVGYNYADIAPHAAYDIDVDDDGRSSKICVIQGSDAIFKTDLQRHRAGGEELKEKEDYAYYENILFNPYLGNDDEIRVIAANADAISAKLNPNNDSRYDSEGGNNGNYGLDNDVHAIVKKANTGNVIIIQGLNDTNPSLSTISIDHHAKALSSSNNTITYVTSTAADTFTAIEEKAPSQLTMQPPNLSAEISNQMCTVCYDKVADYVIIPCGHLCCCSTCLISLKHLKKPCPICRRRIRSMQKVYVSGVTDYSISASKDSRGTLSSNRNSNTISSSNDNTSVVNAAATVDVTSTSGLSVTVANVSTNVSANLEDQNIIPDHQDGKYDDEEDDSIFDADLGSDDEEQDKEEDREDEHELEEKEEEMGDSESGYEMKKVGVHNDIKPEVDDCSSDSINMTAIGALSIVPQVHLPLLPCTPAVHEPARRVVSSSNSSDTATASIIDISTSTSSAADAVACAADRGQISSLHLQLALSDSDNDDGENEDDDVDRKQAVGIVVVKKGGKSRRAVKQSSSRLKDYDDNYSDASGDDDEGGGDVAWM